MSIVSSVSSRLKALGVAGVLLAGALAAIVASRFDATLPANAGIEAQQAPAADRGNLTHDAGIDPVARDEEEFDRKFGMCRRC